MPRCNSTPAPSSCYAVKSRCARNVFHRSMQLCRYRHRAEGLCAHLYTLQHLLLLPQPVVIDEPISILPPSLSSVSPGWSFIFTGASRTRSFSVRMSIIHRMIHRLQCSVHHHTDSRLGLTGEVAGKGPRRNNCIRLSEGEAGAARDLAS